MEIYTPHYGAITQIIDNRTSFSMKDSSGTDFTFEVVPLNMNRDDIIALSPSPTIWFIAYTTTILAPTNSQIQKALRDGLIITLSIKCTIYDNYGISHSIYYDTVTGLYKIEINKYIKNKPLCDSLIKFIKNNDDFLPLINSLLFSFDSIVFGRLFSEIDRLNNIIEDQEDRLKTLERN